MVSRIVWKLGFLVVILFIAGLASESYIDHRDNAAMLADMGPMQVVTNPAGAYSFCYSPKYFRMQRGVDGTFAKLTSVDNKVVVTYYEVPLHTMSIWVYENARDAYFAEQKGGSRGTSLDNGQNGSFRLIATAATSAVMEKMFDRGQHGEMMDIRYPKHSWHFKQLAFDMTDCFLNKDPRWSLN